jgi:hypothetical protein
VKRPITRDAIRCPQCGGRLRLVIDGLVGRLFVPNYYIVERGPRQFEWRMVPAPFVACSRCEFCEEVR